MRDLQAERLRRPVQLCDCRSATNSEGGVMTACHSLALRPTMTVVQIKHGVSTECAGLDLSVEVAAGGWDVQVREGRGGRTLYSAQRCSMSAGKVAAVEYAAMHAIGSAAWPCPDSIAQHLDWKQYW